jgi:hypothetical protein
MALKSSMRVAILRDEMIDIRPLTVRDADAAGMCFGRGGIVLAATGGAASPILTSI